MRQSLVTRLALHAANLLVIAFLLLPMAATTIGALQSAKSLRPLQGDRAAFQPEGPRFRLRAVLRRPALRPCAHVQTRGSD